MILDIGCGTYLGGKRRSGIGLDLYRGKCDIVGDVNYLPFRDECFSYVHARNILEHLDNPLSAMIEVKRVMKERAHISISIPIYHNQSIDELIKYVSNFPFLTISTIKWLVKFTRFRSMRGAIHKNRIRPEHISRYFSIIATFPMRRKHALSYGRKGKLLREILGVILYGIPNTYFVLARKREKAK